MAGKDWASLSLIDAAKALVKLHPPGDALSDPFEIILLEQVGYLCDDAKRAEAFAALRRETKLKPAAIRSAPLPKLIAICRIGGIYPELRAKRLIDTARRVEEDCGGDLAKRLADLSPTARRRLLKGFASIGEPGVDRILLFSGLAAEPALESNGLRVLTRLGLVREEKAYAATYKN